MKTLKMMFAERVVLEFPMVIERIRMYDALVANDIQIWTPEAEWATLDCCKVVPMTEKEMAWFARL